MAEWQTWPFHGHPRTLRPLPRTADDPEFGKPLRRQCREIEWWTEQIVVAVGIADPCRQRGPSRHSATDRSCTDSPSTPELDMRPAIGRAVRALEET
jgi:hypothetical protein